MIPHHAIAVGKVWHHRRQPFEHRFTYPLWWVWCDVDDVDGLLSQHWSWRRRGGVVTFRDSDYIDSSNQSVAIKVRRKATELGFDWQQGKVVMLGQWRTLGTIFNPLVVYLHFAEGSEQPDTMIAEVQNTPWREKHFYPVVWGQASDASGRMYADHDKSFHVSPFLPMALRYHWSLHVAFPDVFLTLEDRETDQSIFKAGLSLNLQPTSAQLMVSVVSRFGAQGINTLRGIYWQALKLWRKGARFYAHPRRKNDNG